MIIDVPGMLSSMPGHIFMHWWQHYRKQPFGPAITNFMQARIAHLIWKTALPESDLTVEDFTPGIVEQVEPPKKDWRTAKASMQLWLNKDGT